MNNTISIGFLGNKRVFITFFLLILGYGYSGSAQQTQDIKGVVTDKMSEQPISGATVTIEGTGLSAITAKDGSFLIRSVSTGRINVKVSSVGYQEIWIPEILVTAGKEVVMEIPLEQNITALKEVTLSSNKKGNVRNEYAGSSARSFSVEEVTRYAGGRNDPSKLVSNFAGVISGDDARNDIVVRGNSPAGVLWRIEGLPSPSPNHFSTLGTTGGPVSALNTNALKNADFYTGAFPAEFGNATAAVFDVSLRTGNQTKHEQMLQVNLFSGLEALAEGPLGNKKSGASYLAGFRYSFVSIGQSFGLNVGTSAVPRYQDWVLNLNYPKTRIGRFSVFGMGGTSNIDFIGKKLDSTDFYSRTDQDTYVKSRFNVFGAKHTIDLNKKSFIRTVLSYSQNRTDFDNFQYPQPAPPYTNRWLITTILDKQQVFRYATFINVKYSARFSWRAGITGEQYYLQSSAKDREGRNGAATFDTLRLFDNSFLLLQYYAQFRYKPSSRIVITGGLHGMSFGFNKSRILEPRASVMFATGKNSNITLSYGLHGQIQPLPVYLYQERINGVNTGNQLLDFSKAHHIVVGVEKRFSTGWRMKTELYYQSLFDIPVEKKASGFSMINAGNDFTFPEKSGLINNGTGTNYGLEFTAERFLSGGLYWMATGSLFESKYKGSDGIERNSSFNYGYMANFLGGKEWKTGKEKNNAFTFDLRFSTIGGRYATPVDLGKSVAAGREVLDESRYNSQKLSNYLRVDTKFGYRVNSKKRKRSQLIYLDLQNVTNRQNVFLSRYNPRRQAVGNVYQIGFFPDILYRLQF